jgi:hypothetical protein
MSMLAERVRYTPEDLLVMPDGKHFELVDGELVEQEAGVRLVWLVDPRARAALVFRPDGSAFSLREEAELTGEEVLPGFRCRVGALFPPAAAGEQQPG